MKIALVLSINYCTYAAGFVQSSAFLKRNVAVSMVGSDPNVILGGNEWKPDSEKMGSTDTGDYFPEGYDKNEVAYTEGMMGSQSGGNSDRGGPQLPGMENLGSDALIRGGIEQASEIPAGMEFIPSSVPDGEIVMDVAASSSGLEYRLSVPPVCMGFEDFFAAFSSDSHPTFSVQPPIGRMDRRGGEPTEFIITSAPNGKAGDFTGNLVINLPEDNSKICFKITAKSF